MGAGTLYDGFDRVIAFQHFHPCTGGASAGEIFLHIFFVPI